jgi:hypothetical protein
MITSTIPQIFHSLAAEKCIRMSDILSTQDGFFLVSKTLSDILAEKEIFDFPDSSGQFLACSSFFDDWFLYAVQDPDGYTYSLLKLREQEHDAEDGTPADGDMPGVTISFISFSCEILLKCLAEPAPENRQALNREINRVVAYGGQRHSEGLKAYFIRTETRGTYLIAELYTEYIASLAENGFLRVPECYAKERQSRGIGGRIPRFIEENNRRSGKVICDHKTIRIEDPLCPTMEERMAILATHTGNTSFFSFAAEVQFHASFLTRWAKIPLPIIGGSPYASAIRADMSIGDAEFTGPTPYYRPDSRMVRKQYHCHKDNL